jgi:hypothetical protein
LAGWEAGSQLPITIGNALLSADEATLPDYGFQFVNRKKLVALRFAAYHHLIDTSVREIR